MAKKKAKARVRIKYITRTITRRIPGPTVVSEATPVAVIASMEDAMESVYLKARALVGTVMSRRASSKGMKDVRHLALVDNAKKLSKAARYMSQAVGFRRSLTRVRGLVV